MEGVEKSERLLASEEAVSKSFDKWDAMGINFVQNIGINTIPMRADLMALRKLLQAHAEFSDEDYAVAFNEALIELSENMYEEMAPTIAAQRRAVRSGMPIAPGSAVLGPDGKPILN